MTPATVVTGGTRGIGLAISRQLLAAGHRVVAIARSLPPEVPKGMQVRCCDLTREQDLSRTFEAIGPVEVLVNNAGISSSGPLHRTTTQQWTDNLAINATGAFWCTRAVLPGMLAAGRGRIVTVASTAALQGAPYVAAYAASKHAVLGMMRVLAAEVAGTGVTANTVCPTFVRTDMTADTIANIAQVTGVSHDDAEHQLTQATPHGRIISPEEVADAVLDLITGNDNGREILLDGGPRT
ncbi:MAG: SDR family NAD(P)-dependent oxidoreductase [Euzebya sp.]